MFRLNNAAEKLFQEIADKNAATYEALIQGLVKVRLMVGRNGMKGVLFVQHKNYKRAFEIFDEMTSKGFQGEELMQKHDGFLWCELLEPMLWSVFE